MSAQGILSPETTLDEWIARETIPFSLSSPETFNSAVAKLITALGDSVELLGFGEGLHGGEDVFILRNRLFQRLVEAHGYSAIAIESSFPRGREVNEYVLGRGAAESYEEVQDGITHTFGKIEANRDLVEWMRQYNADPAHPIKVHFYGFDSPTEMMWSDSPRQLLYFALDTLASVDPASAQEHRQRIDALLGADSAWENDKAAMDPTQSIGGSAEATALRIETEELISEISMRRPELVAKSGKSQFEEALQYAVVARQLLNYHAVVARQSDKRFINLLGLRDAIMADNLAYIVSRERERGKVLAFAHNSHLKRGSASWQLGADLHTWSPAGAQVSAMFGSRYAVIGSGVGVSDENLIGQPEAGTLEARLIATTGPARFIPTHYGQNIPLSEIAALPIRSGSTKNHSYFPFTQQSFTDFDWLVMLDSTSYIRGELW